MTNGEQTRKDRIEGQAVAAWRQAGSSLAIRVEAPFTFRVDACDRRCVAYLPDFGGPNGILLVATVPPVFETDPAFDSAAHDAGYYVSYINIEEYADFSEESFKEALCDWGFFGSEARKPDWLE